MTHSAMHAIQQGQQGQAQGLGGFSLFNNTPVGQAPQPPRTTQRTGGLGLQVDNSQPAPLIPFFLLPGNYPPGFAPRINADGLPMGIGGNVMSDEQLLALEEQLSAAQFLSQQSGVSIEEALGLSQLGLGDDIIKGILFGQGGSGGGASTPLWRPGELELMLQKFGLDQDIFQEQRDQFKQTFGLQEDQFGLSERTLAESTRANKALEADRARGRGLQAAGDALSAYLRASESRDARQIGVLQSLPGLLPSIIDPDQRFFAGLEPGGLLAQAAARFGLGDIGSVPVTPVTLNIGDFIAGDPEAAGTRQDLIDKILEIGGVAGNAAKAETAATQQDVANLQGARSVPGGTVFAGGSPAQQAFEAALKGIN